MTPDTPAASAVSLAELLTPATIRLKVAARDWEEVNELAGQLLLDVGAITPAYVEAMKKTIRDLGPYVVVAPGIALLHARPEGNVKRICMSLLTLEPSIPFGHPENDPVDIAVALGGVDEESHIQALAQLAELLSDDATVARIRAAVEVADVLAIVVQS